MTRLLRYPIYRVRGLSGEGLRAIVLVLSVAIGARIADAADTAREVARPKAVDTVVRVYQDTHHIPGLSVAIVSDLRIVYSRGYGMADLENRVPVDSATRFPTASTLKALTATAVLRLAERGRLDLDAPIQRFCPAYPTKKWPISVLDLLRHQSGIPASAGTEVFNREHFPSVNSVVARFAAKEPTFEPGTSTLYSNDEYSLLACAVEGASGDHYDDYLRREVLAPAGMTSTEPDDSYKVIPHRSRGYVVRTAQNTKDWEGLWTASQLAAIPLDFPVNADPVDPTSSIGAAGYVTTPSDLCRFVIALEDGKLLSPSMRTRMLTPQALKTGAPTRFGLGWIVRSRDGEPSYDVFGSVWTGSSSIMVLPSKRFAVAISTNVEFEQPDDLALQIAQIWGVLSTSR